MSDSKLTLLNQAKKIPVPEPGEIITIKSVELLCVWMKLNNRRVLRWQGNMMVTALNLNKPVAEESMRNSKEKR